MRDKNHYLELFSSTPSATIDYALAASCLYAARFGICEAGHHGTEDWQALARNLKATYGGCLTASEVLSELKRKTYD